MTAQTGVQESRDLKITLSVPVLPAAVVISLYGAGMRHSVLAVPLQANLAVTITALPDPIAVNDTLTYVVIVRNTGADAVRSVMLTDTLPDSVQFLSVPAAPGPCTQTGGEGTTGGTLTCTLGDLASGEITGVTIIVAPTVARNITNVVTITNLADDPYAAGLTAISITTVVPIAGSGQLLPAFAPALQFSNYVGGQDAISEGPALAAASAHRKSSVTSMELSTHTPWPGAMVDVI